MQVVHEPAFLDGQNLVKCPRDMEAQRVALELTSALNLLVGQIAAVRGSEVQLVPVLLGFHAAEDGAEFR